LLIKLKDWLHAGHKADLLHHLLFECTDASKDLPYEKIQRCFEKAGLKLRAEEWKLISKAFNPKDTTTISYTSLVKNIENYVAEKPLWPPPIDKTKPPKVFKIVLPLSEQVPVKKQPKKKKAWIPGSKSNFKGRPVFGGESTTGEGVAYPEDIDAAIVLTRSGVSLRKDKEKEKEGVHVYKKEVFGPRFSKEDRQKMITNWNLAASIKSITAIPTVHPKLFFLM